ncbi:hypothetical protein BKA70DRAFT_1497385 [Coprinopsis sp. MPI-PUGE-AT-0042]|nr:hypothetical protein BKA70DRAFT_1497385 [Coprinopsis sp. MPI-PUGE-AT-0042]
MEGNPPTKRLRREQVGRFAWEGILKTNCQSFGEVDTGAHAFIHGAHSVQITGGSFSVAGGDVPPSHTLPWDDHWGGPTCAPIAIRTRHNNFNTPQGRRVDYPSVTPLDRAGVPTQAHITPSLNRAFTEITKPNLFPVIENSLELAVQLVNSQAGSANNLHRVSPDFQDLMQLVAFASTAYEACNVQTSFGRLVQSAIGSGLSLCNTRLVELHQEMLDLLHPYQAIYHCTGNELKDITLIRSRLNNEKTAFAEWLACLKSFAWKDLQHFFDSGPVLLKEMHVGKIIIIEPLQGDPLSVPIRFVTSFEDIHHVVQFACQGTVGERYIEGRQYQLDDSETNESVDPSRFVKNCLKDGNTFEVAMKLARNTRRCKTRFNTRVSKVPTARRAEMDTIDGYTCTLVLSTTLATEATASNHAQRPSDSDTQSAFKMFRRLTVEILADKEVRMDDDRTLLNVCRYLFGQEATTEASGDSTVDGLFHGLSSLNWDMDKARLRKPRKTRLHVQLSHTFPKSILTGSRGLFKGKHFVRATYQMPYLNSPVATFELQ